MKDPRSTVQDWQRNPKGSPGRKALGNDSPSLSHFTTNSRADRGIIDQGYKERSRVSGERFDCKKTVRYLVQTERIIYKAESAVVSNLAMNSTKNERRERQFIKDTYPNFRIWLSRIGRYLGIIEVLEIIARSTG